MNEEDVRKIIREELGSMFGIDRIIFDKNIQILNARNIQLGRGTGTKFGTAIDQKLGFYGITPVVQQAFTSISDPPTQAEVEVIRDALASLGLTASS